MKFIFASLAGEWLYEENEFFLFRKSPMPCLDLILMRSLLCLFGVELRQKLKMF
jgi:hypothetical protein